MLKPSEMFEVQNAAIRIAATDSLKLGKVANIDEIAPEFIKFWGVPVVRALTRLLGSLGGKNKMQQYSYER